MRRFLVLTLFLLAGLVLPAQTENRRMTITDGSPQGRTMSPEEQAVFDRLQSALADAVQDVFPCMIPTTSADLKSEYEDAKAQQSATDAEDAMERLKESVGAKDVVSVKVTAIGGKFSIDAAYLDMRTGRTEARSGGTIDGSDASLDDFASRFAQGLKKLPGFSKLTNCVAERDWRGTITYRFHAEPTSSTEKDRCVDNMRSSENWKYTVRIPAAGKPSAVVMMTRLVFKESTCKRMGWWCGTGESVDRVAHNTQTSQWIGADRVDVDVSIDEFDGTIHGSVGLPLIKTTLTMDARTDYTTPCNNEAGKPGRFEGPAPIPARGHAFKGPLKPGQKRSIGSFTDRDGGKVTWRLSRTDRKR